jgi:hypothetical protein
MSIFTVFAVEDVSPGAVAKLCSDSWKPDKSVDCHAQMASLIFGVPVGDITKEQRQEGKIENMRLVYGSMSKRVREMLLVFYYVASVNGFYENSGVSRGR